VLLVLDDIGTAQDGKGIVVEIDGLKSRTPPEWKEEKPTSNLRLKQFALPKVGDDKEDALMLILHLEGQGGGVEENVKRWKDMFRPPMGKTIDQASEVKTLTVNGVTATYVDVQGTYTAPPFEKAPPKPDFRLLAVYWNSKKGPYFFRLIGPARTVEHYKKGFDEWVQGFK
jgi:hypothetical protein